MIKYRNMSIPTTLEEIVNPKHSAIIVVDIQNDFVSKGGTWDIHGQPQPHHMSRNDDMVKNTKRLIEEGRKIGVKIVYLQHTNLANHKSDSAPRIYYGLRGFNTSDPSRYPLWCEPDTWGHQVVDELKPQDGDLLIRKHRPSAYMTNLDFLLRANNIKTVLITGDATSGCVEANARDCLYRDYFVVVVRDCVDQAGKEGHDAGLEIMESLMNVEASDRIIEIWKKMKHA